MNILLVNLGEDPTPRTNHPTPELFSRVTLIKQQFLFFSS
jgi:hypothetical protein